MADDADRRNFYRVHFNKGIVMPKNGFVTQWDHEMFGAADFWNLVKARLVTGRLVP